MSRKVIITCAVTGAIHTPSMSKALPVTPQEIADAAIDAAEAGAAIVHLHARNPKTGQPDQSPEAFAPFLKIIKQRSNCVINLTTGGAPTMTVDERVRPAAVYKPEVASLNMGSMNFGFFGMLNRFKKFEHDWELQASAEQGHRVPQHLPGHRIRAEDAVGDRHALRVRMLRHRASLQSELFPRAGPGEAAAVRADGVRPAGRHRRASGGRAAHEAHRRPAVRRQVSSGRCSAPAAISCRSRRWRPRWAATSASAWRIRCGPRRAGWRHRTPSRCTLARKIIEGLGLEVATPDEAREILDLKGGDKLSV